MKLIYFFTFTFFCFYGCQKQKKYYAIDPPLMLKLENKIGQNLLDPATVGHIDEKNIRVSYLIDGIEQPYYKPNLDWPNGYSISSTISAGYVVTVVYNRESKQNPTTTYIDWGNGNKDTIVCAMTVNDGTYQFVTDIWYNGLKVFTKGEKGEWLLKIIK